MKNILNLFVCSFISVILMTSCVRTQKGYFDSRTNSQYPMVKQNRNYSESKMPHKPGACFAKCLIPDQVQIDSLFFYVFTGDRNVETVDEYEEIFIIQEAGSVWVKKPSPNCRSANPNDCLVWCLEKTTEKIETRTILVDTTQTKNFNEDFIVIETVINEGGFTEWREVLCEKNISSRIIEEISLALVANGYQSQELMSHKMDKNFKAALLKFQKDNGLPTGQLDLETLDALEVSY